MTGGAQGIEADGQRGEEAFARLCDQWKCEYLHVGQKPDLLSSQLFRNLGKRPDFFVNIPDVSPIFVEVKVRKQGRARLVGPKSKLPAFGIEHAEFSRMSNFESRIRICTWYAFLEKSDERIDETVAYVSPVSRIARFIPKSMQGDTKKWPWIWIPRQCLNRCEKRLDLSDRCIECPDKICEHPDL